MFKKITSALLALALVCSFALPVMALTYTDITSAEDLAKALAGKDAYEEAGITVVGETVTVNGDVSIAQKITFGRDADITLVVNGSVTSTSADGRIFEIGSDAKLTIQGTGTISTAQDAVGNAAAIKVAGGELNVEGGSISAVDTAIYAAASGTVNIKGGTVSSSGEIAVSTKGNESGANITISGGTVQASSEYPAVYAPSGKVTVEGSANVTGGAGIVARKGGNVEVKGGTVTGTNPNGTVTAGDGGNAVAPGGAIVANESSEGKVTVSGENATVNGTVEAVTGTAHDDDGNGNIDIQAGTFTSPGGNFDSYVNEGVAAEGKVGDTYTVGSVASVQEAVKNAKPGQQVTVEKAPAGTPFNVEPGVVLNNATGNVIKINGNDVKSGESFAARVPDAPTPVPDPSEFIVCEACGHHDWEPYLEGWRCTNCGHLRGTTGVAGTAAKAASTAPKSPQTGLWWLLG